MIVLEKGKALGTVGGGALENQACTVAQDVLKRGVPRLLKFNMSGTDISGDGSICGGSVKLLVEQFTPKLQQQLQLLPVVGQFSAPCLMITGFDPDAAEPVFHLSVQADRLGDVPDFIRTEAQTAFEQRTSVKHCTTRKVFLLRYYAPEPVLHIFGAGHVGAAVADLAGFLNTNVKIFDDRPEFANPKRFPAALNVSSEPLEILRKTLSFNNGDMALVTTRNHKSDLQLMRWLLNIDLGYLGLMSSRRKWKLLADALRKEDVPAEKIATVFAPVGFDIGADTVPEIALSIMAEVVHQRKKQSASVLSIKGQ